MRIALLSDIHGNTIAFDAVLEDIQTQGDVDAYWILGDLVCLGPDPLGVLERISGLEHVVAVRGNTDHYLVANSTPTPQIAWTQHLVKEEKAKWLSWVDALPIESRLVLPDGTRLLGVHASPGQYDGVGIHPKLTVQALARQVSGCDADLVCVGHTHWPMNCHIDGIHVINLGAVSNPLPPDLSACYAMLDADTTGYQIEHRRVEYDRESVIDMVRRVQYPDADRLIDGFRGLVGPRWQMPTLDP